MLSIKKYNKKLINEWNKFIQSSNNGNLFNNQLFLSYHLDRSFNNHSLMFYSKNKIIAVLPAAIHMINKKNVLYSHLGASYGGLIIALDTKFSDINQIINLLDNYCCENNFDSIVLINAPQIYFIKPDESLDYLLLWKNYIIKEQYVSHVVDLRHSNNITNLLTKRKQRYINNSSDFNDFKFEESNISDEFYNLLFELKQMYQTKPTHSIDELKKIKELFPNECMLVLSFLDSNIVGGTLMLFINKRVGLIFYNVVANQFRQSQLSMYQLYNCMCLVKKRGCDFVDFGVSQNPEQKNPLSPKLSLINFKEQLGARGIIRTIYKKDFKRE